MVLQVVRAISSLRRRGARVSFYAVAAESGVARSTLYRCDDLRKLVEDARGAEWGACQMADAARKTPVASPTVPVDIESPFNRVAGAEAFPWHRAYTQATDPAIAYTYVPWPAAWLGKDNREEGHPLKVVTP